MPKEKHWVAYLQKNTISCLCGWVFEADGSYREDAAQNKLLDEFNLHKDLMRMFVCVHCNQDRRNHNDKLHLWQGPPRKKENNG